MNLLQSCFLLFCFFFCWHSEHGGNRQHFFIGHMPLHNDLWMRALCRLILLSMHYVAQPSMVMGGGGAPLLHTHMLSIHPLTDAAVHSIFSPIFLFLCLSNYDWKPLKDGATHQRSVGSKCFYTILTKPCVLVSLHIFAATVFFPSFFIIATYYSDFLINTKVLIIHEII